MADGVVRRLPVKGKDGSIELIEIESIFYLEAKGHDTLIRTRRKNLTIPFSGWVSLPKSFPHRPSCAAIENTSSI